MPSSKGYVRDLKQEYATQKARGDVIVGKDDPNNMRKRLRRAAVKVGKVKPGQDLDHVKPLSKGGANSLKNARAVSPHANRSFPRNKDGSMK